MYVSTSGLSGCPACMGLGQTIDLSSWTWEDWVLLGIGGVVLFSLLEKGKAKATKAIRRRRSSVSAGGSSDFTEIGIIALLGAAFIGYLYFSQSGGSGT